MRIFDQPGRSPVYATDGMVATSHPLASSTALNILRTGGNAVDAAIAASTVLSVVEPQMTGIGGDCFCIVAEPDGTLHGLNGSGRSAMNTDLDWYIAQNVKNLETLPAHTVTTPGAVKAWEILHQRFGSQDFEQLFLDAINYAKNGFRIAPRVAADWKKASCLLRKNLAASEQYLVNNQAPDSGQKHRLPFLASTLELISKRGSTGFYGGRVAQDIIESVQNAGGLLTEEDLASVSADWVNLISTNYRGYDLHEIPPNGQGITALILLNLLNKLGSHKLPVNSSERVHLEMECARLAYSVSDQYVADSDHMVASVESILSEPFTATLAQQFDKSERNNSISLPALPESDTVYLTVVDRDLRAVSFINSIYHTFGSGIVTPKTGVVLQNRGAGFSLAPGHVNSLGPGKRPMHTIIPAMVSKMGRVEFCYGVMGGAYQPVGHAHVLTNMLDYGMDPQAALDHHRVFWGNDDVLELESGAPVELATKLESLGHPTRKAPSPHGGGQVIQIDHDSGTLIGGSDPRKDGHAAGY